MGRHDGHDDTEDRWAHGEDIRSRVQCRRECRRQWYAIPFRRPSRSLDGPISTTGSYDSTVRLWDLKSQNRQAIQVLDEARDAVQTLHVGPTYVLTGSVDGYVRTYDLRMGELRSDFIGRTCPRYAPSRQSVTLVHSQIRSRRSSPRRTARRTSRRPSTRTSASWTRPPGRC